jgi:hypothetical protein
MYRWKGIADGPATFSRLGLPQRAKYGHDAHTAIPDSKISLEPRHPIAIKYEVTLRDRHVRKEIASL